ncbi:MAG TPA: hypothetical protein ENJ00_12040 [Phycisphaerales bacterium]|nr:hypothetical protein [Phycisphaerales bacterium]
MTRLIHSFERQGVWVRDVVLGAPPDELSSAVLELPPRSSGAPIEQLARAELERDGIGPMEVAVWDLPDGPRTRAHEYLVVGLGYEISNGLIEPFRRLDIGVIAIEPAVSAIGRATGNGRRLVIDFGLNSARMYAYDDSQVLFLRTIQFDSKHVDIDRVFRGIDNNIEYLVGRFPALEDARILLVGENRALSGLAKLIESEYETSVSCGIDIPDDGSSWISRAEFGRQWATAVGLASWRIAEGVAA